MRLDLLFLPTLLAVELTQAISLSVSNHLHPGEIPFDDISPRGVKLDAIWDEHARPDSCVLTITSIRLAKYYVASEVQSMSRNANYKGVARTGCTEKTLGTSRRVGRVQLRFSLRMSALTCLSSAGLISSSSKALLK